ncbi:MAG: DUF3048 domain-containing protein [Bacilli bacterium]|nr:DUF3048 domain-containing protein [Bacilli bacterium]
MQLSKLKPRRMTKDNKKYYIAGGIGVAVLVGLACFWFFLGNHENEVAKSDGPSQPAFEEETPPVVEEEKITIVDPTSSSRPFAVMINNISVARPYQSGLQDAYIIYELIAEGGITRFLALFKNQSTSRIGTVRSARHYYLDYVLENDAYFVHWGWSPQAQADISSLKINNINGLVYSNKYFWKDTSLNVATEHTAYTNMEKLKQAVSDLNYRTTSDKDLLLKYSATKLDLASMSEATKAEHVSIKYSTSTTSSYEYDSEKDVYFRSINGKSHVDYVTKEQYSFKNIITYQVKNATIGGDEKGRQDLNNIGTGTGYYISGGYAVPIKWEKKDRSSQTKYYYMNGEELVVNDGNTFIQIQPQGLSLDIS